MGWIVKVVRASACSPSLDARESRAFYLIVCVLSAVSASPVNTTTQERRRRKHKLAGTSYSQNSERSMPKSYRKQERSSKNKQAASDKVSEWTTRNETRAPYLFHFLVGVTNARVVFVKFLDSTCKAAAGMIRIKVPIHQNIQSARGRRLV